MEPSSMLRTLLLLPVVALGACQSPAVPALMQEEPAHAQGVVTQHEETSEGLRFLVEDRPDADTGEKFFVTIDARTGIFSRTASGDTVLSDSRDVPLQSSVEVWFEGQILESYPAQGVAKYVLLTHARP